MPKSWIVIPLIVEYRFLFKENGVKIPRLNLPNIETVTSRMADLSFGSRRRVIFSLYGAVDSLEMV